MLSLAPTSEARGLTARGTQDLLDIASGAQEIAITLRWAGRGLADAWEREEELERSRRVALGTLRQAQADLAALIGELQECRT